MSEKINFTIHTDGDGTWPEMKSMGLSETFTVDRNVEIAQLEWNIVQASVDWYEGLATRSTSESAAKYEAVTKAISALIAARETAPEGISYTVENNLNIAGVDTAKFAKQPTDVAREKE